MSRVIGQIAQLARVLAQVEQLLAFGISTVDPDINLVSLDQRCPRPAILEQLRRIRIERIGRDDFRECRRSRVDRSTVPGRRG